MTMIELLVTLAIFTIFVLASTSGLLNILRYSSESRASSQVLDELDSLMEQITREVRFGKIGTANVTVGAGGRQELGFIDYNGQPITYFLTPDPDGLGGPEIGYITRESNGVSRRLTSSRVNIVDGRFYTQNNNFATISIVGQPAGGTGNQFWLESSVSQRREN